MPAGMCVGQRGARIYLATVDRENVTKLTVGIDVREADPRGPGQQRYLWRLGRWLAEGGDAVHFLTVRPQLAEVACPPGSKLHRLAGASRSEFRERVSGLSLDALLLNPERARRYRGIAANVLRPGYGTDHYVQKLRSFRRPLAALGPRALRWTPWKLAERRWERRFYETTGAAPHVIAVSELMRREVLATYSVPESHVHVVPNGVDLNEFSPERRDEHREAQRRAWGVPEDALCLLLMGHNFRLKGLWQVLPALARWREEGGPDVHLLVAGRGTGPLQRTQAERMVRRLGLDKRVHRLGPVSPSYLGYAPADALLHLSWHDSFGFAVLEAMAMGLPVVTTPRVGASELIEDGANGLVVDPCDPDAVARALATLGDPDVRDRLGSAAAATAADYPEERSFAGVRGVMVGEGTPLTP